MVVTANLIPQPCYSHTFVETDFLRHFPGGFTSYHEGASAQRVMAAINAVPPVTDFQADAVLLLLAPRLPTIVYFVDFTAGCARGRGRVPRASVAVFLLTAA